VGDTLVAVLNASGANSTITAPAGWTVLDSTAAPHARMYLSREATGNSADDITITVSTADGISGVMVAYRGMSYDDWVWLGADESDTVSPYTTPVSGGAIDIGAGSGAFVGFFSCQQNGGQGGGMTVSVDSGGSLVAQAEGIRTSFSGGLCAIADNLNTTGSQQIGITFTGNNTSGFATLYGYNVTPAVTIATQGPFDPVRADARADALSVARNFNAPPVDVNLSQSFLPEPLEVIDPDIITAFDESLTPGTAEFYYLPLGRQSSEYLQEFTGETMLARMGRTFPGPIMELVSNIGSSIITSNITSDNTVDARYAIEYVFSQWAATYPWFNYSSPVPDLRVPLVGGDYSGDAGKVFTRTITIPQGDDAERSMFDIAQELLAPFGAVRTVNDNNAFAIQPRYGPDSDATAVVTLKDNDLYSLSTGDPSRVGTKNRITVEKRPYDRDVDVIAMQEAYWQIRHSLFDAQYLITDRTADPPDAIPDARLDLTDGTGTSFQSGYALRYDPLLWPAGAGIVAEDVGFVDTSPAVTLDVDFYAYNLGNTGVNITKNYVSDAEVTLPSIGNILPDGNWYTALTAQYSNSSGTPTSMFVTLEGRWVNEQGARGIQFRVADSNLVAVGWTVGVTIYPFDTFVGTFAIKLTDASAAWVDRGTSTRVTFGIAGTDTLPSATGDAIQESEDARGILEEVISIGPYNPSVDQMSQIAEGILFDKIQPRSIVRGEQSVVRAFPVRFSHLGRLVQLPDGTSGDVMSRDYREASPPIGGAGDIGSGFEVMVLGDGAGAVDTSSDFLLLESGSNLLLESGDSILLEA
jgi:hypothetical protein